MGGASDEDETESKWKQESCKLRHKIGMPHDAMPYVDSSAAGRVLVARQRDVMAVAYAHYMLELAKQSSVSVPLWWFCDLSQDVSRKPWGANVPMLGQRSLPYSFNLHRLLDPEDFLGVLIKQN
jgi:hypothetical protein